MNLQWTMINSKTFTASKDGYDVKIKNAIEWHISNKNGLIVDCCLFHNIPTDELDAKVKSERALQSLLDKKKSDELPAIGWDIPLK